MTVISGINFADPSIVQLNGESWAFATRGNGYNVQMASSANFKDPSTWQFKKTDAFPKLPSWVITGEVWAPEVAHLTAYDNSFAMYYSGHANINGKDVHCLGLARSDAVSGPYADHLEAPWLIDQDFTGGCREDAGGQIDPSLFIDSDGSWYVVYKLDGPRTCGWKEFSENCHKTPLYLVKLDRNHEGKIDGEQLVKDDSWPLYLFDNKGADDEYNIEAPSLVMSNDGKTHFMFFSRGSTCESICADLEV